MNKEIFICNIFAIVLISILTVLVSCAATDVTSFVPPSPSNSHRRSFLRTAPKHQFKKFAQELPIDLSDDIENDISVPSMPKSPWINWFPLAFESFLLKHRPTRHYILGSPVVVWSNRTNDASQPQRNFQHNDTQWYAMVDICPHRLAPLSEGRVVKEGTRRGCIECPYHGWAFEGNRGTCLHIPQQTQSSKLDSFPSKSAGIALPAVVRQGILWVHTAPLFLDDPNNSHERNIEPPDPSGIDPFLVEQLDDKDVSYTDYFRDLPMEWSTLIENVIDPSHLPYTHHKTIGKRPPDQIDPNTQSSSSPATPLQLTTPITSKGFSAHRSTSNPGTVTFLAPNLVVSCTDRRSTSNPFRDWNIAYAIPTLPGKCRLLVRVAFETGKMTNVPMKVAFETALGGNVPQWLLHLKNHEILEDDNIFLHHQMHNCEVALKASEKWDDQDGDSPKLQGKPRVPFLPTSSDATVAAFQQWCSKYSAAEKMWTPYTPEGAFRQKQNILSTKELLDRKETHTDQCASCYGARETLLNKIEPLLKLTMVMASIVEVILLWKNPTQTTTILQGSGYENMAEILPIISFILAYLARDAVTQTVRKMEDGTYPPSRNKD